MALKNLRIAAISAHLLDCLVEGIGNLLMLRVFAAATPNGWTVLPGGFCRIADQPDARAVSMGDGASAA